MSTVDFGEIPPFVRIKSVYMRQFWTSISRHLLPMLKQFSGNFISSLNVRLNASIDWYNKLPGHSFNDRDFFPINYDEFFASPMEFVSCLREILEIFEQCLPQFTFCVNDPYYQEMDSLSLIASTLGLSSVQVSDNVRFLFPALSEYYYHRDNQHSFQNQVKVISDWLHRPYMRSSSNTPSFECIRSLTIGSTERGLRLMSISRNNIEQLIEDLKLVSFLLFIKILMSLKLISTGQKCQMFVGELSKNCFNTSDNYLNVPNNYLLTD